MAALCNRRVHYIFALWFLSSFFLSFFFSSPNLSGRRLDVYHTSRHGVAFLRIFEFRMHVWNVLHVAHWKYRTKKIAKNAPSGHHRTTLSDDSFATKAYIDNRKNMLNSNISSTCAINTVNFGPLAAEIHWRVWGTPVIMVALWNRADHYSFALWLLSIFFSSPNLRGRRLDVYHTSTHGVALVRI